MLSTRLVDKEDDVVQRHVHRKSAPGLEKTTWTTWIPFFGGEHHKKIILTKKNMYDV